MKTVGTQIGGGFIIALPINVAEVPFFWNVLNVSHK
jgi:hypothetical protein